MIFTASLKTRLLTRRRKIGDEVVWRTNRTGSSISRFETRGSGFLNVGNRKAASRPFWRRRDRCRHGCLLSLVACQAKQRADAAQTHGEISISSNTKTLVSFCLLALFTFFVSIVLRDGGWITHRWTKRYEDTRGDIGENLSSSLSDRSVCFVSDFSYLELGFLWPRLLIVFALAIVVVVHLRATGDAPILKQAKFKVPVSFFPRLSLPLWALFFWEGMWNYAFISRFCYLKSVSYVFFVDCDHCSFYIVYGFLHVMWSYNLKMNITSHPFSWSPILYLFREKNLQCLVFFFSICYHYCF